MGRSFPGSLALLLFSSKQILMVVQLWEQSQARRIWLVFMVLTSFYSVNHSLIVYHPLTLIIDEIYVNLNFIQSKTLAMDNAVLANTPALAPPLGITSNFTDPPTLSTIVITIDVLFLTLMLPIAILRLYSKIWLAHSFWYDDGKSPSPNACQPVNEGQSPVSLQQSVHVHCTSCLDTYAYDRWALWPIAQQCCLVGTRRLSTTPAKANKRKALKVTGRHMWDVPVVAFTPDILAV